MGILVLLTRVPVATTRAQTPLVARVVVLGPTFVPVVTMSQIQELTLGNIPLCRRCVRVSVVVIRTPALLALTPLILKANE